ncbi:MAG: helix-turn-helix domain-containing protein, partial [Pseudonocardiaceae bacterium]
MLEVRDGQSGDVEGAGEVDREHRFPLVGVHLLDRGPRLAVHHADAVIAGILNRQGRRTAHTPPIESRACDTTGASSATTRTPSRPKEELLTVAQAAATLGLAPSTLHRWLGDGFIAGEPTTPGAPWRIRLNDKLRTLSSMAPPKFVLLSLEPLWRHVGTPYVAQCVAHFTHRGVGGEGPLHRVQQVAGDVL